MIEEATISEQNGINLAFFKNGSATVVHSDSNLPLRQFLRENCKNDYENFSIYNSDTTTDFSPVDSEKCGLICTQKINSIRRVNKFFEAANKHLSNDQFMVICLETKEQRKERVQNKYPRILSKPFYLADFILKRVFPKTKPTRKIYFSITKGKNRVISLTEALGRLVSCGFEIVGYKKIGNLTYIISKKVRKPFFDMQPTYGAIIKLNRVGYKGKMFYVYKVRTMYPYSEYLQDYVYQLSSLESGGKFKDDFRTTSYGNFFRRFWIDELPMLFNWLRREMKLVGVRPLSEQYFYLYPEELQEMRIKTKPGLVPPYYADMPKGLEEILESERRYLEAYQKNPFKTDIQYFFKAFKNILVLGARSR